MSESEKEMVTRLVKRQFEDIRARIPKIMKGIPSARPFVWTGKVYELGEVILRLYNKGLIKASSEMNALEQACGHFVKPDGKPFDARTLWDGVQQRRKKAQGKPRH